MLQLWNPLQLHPGPRDHAVNRCEACNVYLTICTLVLAMLTNIGGTAVCICQFCWKLDNDFDIFFIPMLLEKSKWERSPNLPNRPERENCMHLEKTLWNWNLLYLQKNMRDRFPKCHRQYFKRYFISWPHTIFLFVNYLVFGKK